VEFTDSEKWDLPETKKLQGLCVTDSGEKSRVSPRIERQIEMPPSWKVGDIWELGKSLGKQGSYWG